MVLKKRLTKLGSMLSKPNASEDNFESDADTPEANAVRGVRNFCESGAANSGEEVLYLPTIVESAVASPPAAHAAAAQIRKFLSKENYTRPHVQYNAVMLIRILADNPGPSFTKNLDKQFADTVKHLLRNGQDPSVAQILRETLDALEREKAYDTNMNTLFVMWRKEKGLMQNAAKQFGPRTLNAPPWNGSQQGYGQSGTGSGRSHSKTLPPPTELAGRVEEARTSAKLLLQLVQSTPPNELLGNDLIKEFSERCMSAQRSIQGFINCDNPPPDDDTMLTLIETNEQLSLAASKHQRGVLQARRLHGPVPSPPISQVNSNNAPSGPMPATTYDPPAGPPATSYNPPAAAPPSSYPGPLAPAAHDHSSNDPPILPSLGLGSREENQRPTPARKKTDEPPLPPSLQAAPGRPQAGTAPEPDDDPFADHHTSAYSAPHGGPPGARDDVQTNGGEQTRGSPMSYNAGYQSTPSYLGRQESSANNMTMHGAQHYQTEEEEHARDHPVGGGPRSPEQTRQQAPDVSPIAERGTVTYRY